MWRLFTAYWTIQSKKRSARNGQPSQSKSRKAKGPSLESLESRLNPAFIYGVDNDWGSGFQAHGLLTNDQSVRMDNWKIEFDYNRDITSIWNGEITSKVGNHYVIQPKAYNRSIDVGANVNIGFIGSGGLSADKPFNTVISFNGTSTPPTLTGLSVANLSQIEGNSGAKYAVFTVSSSSASTTAISVNYSTTNGTATSGTDYTSTSGTLTFAPGETSKTISVLVLGDTDNEPDEAFNVVLSSPVGATLSKGSALGTISNDDALPTIPNLSIGDVRITEGNSGSKNASLVVTLSRASASTVSVAYATADGVAKSGSDFTGASGTLTFLAGQTSRTLDVAISGDLAVEPDEVFTMMLSAPVGATLSRAMGVVNIVNDDSGPVLPTPLSAKADLAISTVWGSGFTANVVIANTGTTPINGWQIAFDFPIAISNIWNASVLSKTGNRFIIKDAGYNAVIAPGSTVSFGFNGSPGNVTAGPTNWTLNGTAITGSFNGGTSAPPATPTSPPVITIGNTSIQVGVPSNGIAPGYFRTKGSQIVDASGQVTRIAGVNWFGMESNTFAPHGLWTRGYKEMMDQMKQLGFNTIRMPFSNQLFDSGSKPNGIDFSKNPDLQGLNGLQVLDKIVDYAGKIGLRIFLDHHRSDAGAGTEGSGLWYTSAYPESRFISDWKMLAAHYANNPALIGADLHNEPHGPATWGSGVLATDWRLAAQRAGNAVLSVNPNWLIIVEGIESTTSGNYWWGGNLSKAGEFPVQLDVANRLVYSPHDYPASVYPQSWFSAPDFPYNLSAVWDKNWGYLFKNGTAPVLLGEFGSNLTTASDQQWLNTLVKYMQGGITGGSLPGGQQGPSWTYWSWNPNSGDTGGILADDWRTVNQSKMKAVQPMEFPFSTSNDGKVVTSFLVTLSQASTKTVTVNFSTVDGTAKDGINFTATSGTLTFAPGETQKSVPVTILPDGSMSTDLVFTMQLTNPVEGILATATKGTGTIKKR